MMSPNFNSLSEKRALGLRFRLSSDMYYLDTVTLL